MKAADVVIKNIGKLTTPRPYAEPLRGKAMDNVVEIDHAFIAIKDGVIIDFGQGDGSAFIDEKTIIHDAENNLVTPGLVDSHTHVVHYGSREYEFEKKMRGVDYLQILKEGGGILSSVKMTTDATERQLYKQSKKSLDIMLKHGTTTVEGKSGYGLFEETELKQLRVQKQLNGNHPVDIIPTFLGAHALPKSHENKRKAFLDQVVKTMDIVKKEDLAEFVDVFCEKGAFTLEESTYILSEAKKRGFKLKIHADEIEALGGVEMAVSLGAKSADHLMVVNDKGIDALASANTIANILPSTSFNLQSAYAPARKMLQNNVALAISSDYNPGSSPSENFLFTLNLAAIHMKLSPNEILNAATINAAHSIDRGQNIGAIAKGYKADINIYEAKNWPYVLYHFAINHVKDVFKNGKLVVKNQTLIEKG